MIPPSLKPWSSCILGFSSIPKGSWIQDVIFKGKISPNYGSSSNMSAYQTFAIYVKKSIIQPWCVHNRRVDKSPIIILNGNMVVGWDWKREILQIEGMLHWSLPENHLMERKTAHPHKVRPDMTCKVRLFLIRIKLMYLSILSQPIFIKMLLKIPYPSPKTHNHIILSLKPITVWIAISPGLTRNNLLNYSL